MLDRFSFAAQRRLRTALLLTLVPFVATQAAEWRHLEPQQDLPYEPTFFAPGADDVVWSFDGAVVRRSGGDGSDTTPYRNVFAAGLDAQVYVQGTATADGGLVADDGDCGLLRITPDQRATWRVRPPVQSCRGVRVAADGSSWVAGTRGSDGEALYQLGLDGVTLAKRRPGANELALFTMNRLVDFAALPGGGDLELSHSLQNTDVSLIRRDADARIAWTFALPSARDRTRLLAAADDGGADVVGSTGNNLWVSRVDAQGQPVFARQLAMDTAAAVLAARRAPAGALYVVAGDETSAGQVPRRVLRID
uniref:hypothetical protein n=1 Tax=Tahibacter caeni TaxID=1453545 RepID=UPI002149357D